MEPTLPGNVRFLEDGQAQVLRCEECAYLGKPDIKVWEATKTQPPLFVLRGLAERHNDELHSTDIEQEREEERERMADDTMNDILMADTDNEASSIAQRWGDEKDYPWVVTEALRLRTTAPPEANPAEHTQQEEWHD